LRYLELPKSRRIGRSVRGVAFPRRQETNRPVIEGSVAWRAFDIAKFITEYKKGL
jgi:predicted DNA-binding transcriptional regulator AlpA